MSEQDAIGAVEEIDAIVSRFDLEKANQALVRELLALLDRVRKQAENSTDVYIKVRELKDWIDILRDPAKHERFGGAERVKELTRHSCTALKRTLTRSHGSD